MQPWLNVALDAGNRPPLAAVRQPVELVDRRCRRRCVTTSFLHSCLPERRRSSFSWKCSQIRLASSRSVGAKRSDSARRPQVAAVDRVAGDLVGGVAVALGPGAGEAQRDLVLDQRDVDHALQAVEL